MKPLSDLGSLVGRFMAAMHRYDGGRTLPILHAARLTTPQLAALEFVRTPHTVSAVALHLGLSRPATSQMIDKLVRRRLVRRSEGAVDRREKMIVLSVTGKALVERIEHARAARFQASLAVLPAPIALRLQAVLQQVIETL
jgi:DNA-binding MarR family transcriptional regulator